MKRCPHIWHYLMFGFRWCPMLSQSVPSRGFALPGALDFDAEWKGRRQSESHLL